MYTYEMVALAEQNGKTYKCENTFYRKSRGFYLDFFLGDDPILTSDSYEGYVDKLGRRELHAFIMEDGWEEVK